MKKSHIRIIIISSLSSIFVLCLLTLIAFSVHFLTKYSKVSESEKEYYQYQVIRTYKHANYSSVGFATLPTKLEIDEFISYQSSEYYQLISNLGTKEYQCTGVCVCGKSSSSRKAVSIPVSQKVTRGLIYLVASMSSVLAFQKAKEHFENECRQSFSVTDEKCATVSSEVDNCEKVVYSTEESFSKTSWDKEEEKRLASSQNNNDAKEDKGKRKRYMCKGHCLPNLRIKKKNLREEVEKASCEIEELECEIVVEKCIGKKPCVEEGREQFMQIELEDFCQQISEVRCWDCVADDYGYSRRTWKKNIQVCVGHNRFQNPSVVCKEI